MAWHRRSPRREPAHRPDAQNVLTRLDSVVDRLEGAFEQLDRLVPLLDQYAKSLLDQRDGGE